MHERVLSSTSKHAQSLQSLASSQHHGRSGAWVTRKRPYCESHAEKQQPPQYQWQHLQGDMQQQFPLQQRHGPNGSSASSSRCEDFPARASTQLAKHGAQTHGRKVQHP